MKLSRSRFAPYSWTGVIAATCAVIVLVAVTISFGRPSGAAVPESFTRWGWPLPYQQVSPKSVAWLKDKGWWPITVAWQGPFSGENSTNVVMERSRLLQKRGIDATFIEFGNGPAVNESIIAGRAQVGSGGNFPFTTLIDKGVPVLGLATVAPNLQHCVIVPNDSPMKRLKDVAGTKSQVAVGLVTGSSAEFYFQEAARLQGVTVGKDVTLVNMPIPDQLSLPKGIGAVVPWEPSCSIIAKQLKTGRIIDSIFPYNMYQGTFYVRSELAKNVPDVVQAITDAFAEATLLIRLNPRETAKYLAEAPGLKQYPEALLLEQTLTYNNLYKPTYIYPFAQFWSDENARIAAFLYQGKRITHSLSASDYRNAYDESYMSNTFKKLGWKIPSEPPFIPPGWQGKVGSPPYPAYDTVETLKTAQAFPQKGDLAKAWSFDGKSYQP